MSAPDPFDMHGGMSPHGFRMTGSFIDEADPKPQKYTPKYYAGTEAMVTVPPKTCAKDFLQEFEDAEGPVDKFALKYGLTGLLNEFLVYLDLHAGSTIQSPTQSEFDLEG